MDNIQPIPVTTTATKSNNVMELLQKYWWVIVLLLIAYLIYRYKQSQPDSSDESPDKH